MEIDGDGEWVQREEIYGIRFGGSGGDALTGRLQLAYVEVLLSEVILGLDLVAKMEPFKGIKFVEEELILEF